MEKPVHQHDCDCCQYVGTKEYFVDDNTKPIQVDLYVCKEMDATNAIGRFGVDGDYISHLRGAMYHINEKALNPNYSNFDKITHYINTFNEKEDSMHALILGEAAIRAINQNILADDLTFIQPVKKNKP